MKELVELILENSKKVQKEIHPKQVFYREFDLALQLAARRELNPSEQIERLERYGQEAGISPAEIAYRKKTLLWTAAQSE